MNVTCPDCHSVFRVDPAKVPPSGVRARCSVCGGVIAIARASAAVSHGSAAAPAPAHQFEAAETASGAAPGVEESVATATPARAPQHAEVPPVQDPDVTHTATARELAEGPPAEPTSPSRPARPFNPYLSNTPELRARRLARALVSDLVAYNPQKREEGLRDGTLRQLFREEIRKSWEEYVEQVGAQVAESTPHFQDALNDVLAGGRRVF